MCENRKIIVGILSDVCSGKSNEDRKWRDAYEVYDITGF